MTWPINNFKKLLIIVMIGHFIAGFAFSLFMHQRFESGLLEGTDEIRNVAVAHDLADYWRKGSLVTYASISVGDPHSGYYYVLAALDYVGIGHPLSWRLINTCVAFLAILLWWYALVKNEEKENIRNLYLVFLLLCPSMLFMSSWIIKEAWLYMFSGLVAVSIARLARPSVRNDHWRTLGLLIGCLVIIGIFRGYEALIIGLVAIAFISARLGWYKALLCISTAVGLALFFNYETVIFYTQVITGLDLHSMSLSDFSYVHYEHAVKFYENFLSENRAGNSAIDASVSWFGKLWLFFSFPLPWQAHSSLQKLAVPEVLVFLMLLPGMFYGMMLKVARKDKFAIFMLVWFALLALLYITVNTNLGTMYRHKASLMFMMLYFAAVGIVEIYEKYQLRSQYRKFA